MHCVHCLPPDSANRAVVTAEQGDIAVIRKLIDEWHSGGWSPRKDQRDEAHVRLHRLAAALERAERERDALDVAIASYAEVSGVLVHSWPDDERERQRQSLYADVKWMRTALDGQADTIEKLKRERDSWKEHAQAVSEEVT